jgi:hypothetical protein
MYIKGSDQMSDLFHLTIHSRFLSMVFSSFIQVHEWRVYHHSLSGEKNRYHNEGDEGEKKRNYGLFYTVR